MTADLGNDETLASERATDPHPLRELLRRRLFGEGIPAKIGRYAIERQLGAGGMGMVFLAHDPDLERPVAVKVLRPGVGEGSEGRTRLVREAQAMAKLAHPNVAAVFEVGREDELVYVAMEYVPGQTLRQ